MKKLNRFINKNKGEAGAIGRVKPHLQVISVERLQEYLKNNKINQS